MRNLRVVPDIACQRLLRLSPGRATPVTASGISYVEYLRREVQDRLQGVGTVCGPPVVDFPTLLERIWPYKRPNYHLEAQLEAQLRELGAEPRELEI
jgi:hypothetical protein